MREGRDARWTVLRRVLWPDPGLDGDLFAEFDRVDHLARRACRLDDRRCVDRQAAARQPCRVLWVRDRQVERRAHPRDVVHRRASAFLKSVQRL